MASIKGKATSGSQMWTQKLVNDCPELLNREIAQWSESRISADNIRWVSPIRDKEYREYYGSSFIKKLGITLDKCLLGSFWPTSGRGATWDGLAIAGESSLLLEAKSHISELGNSNSGGSKATPESLKKICASLDLTKRHMGVSKAFDWARSPYYQYANRLAHLYLLRELNDIPAFLVMLYFLNSGQVGAPSSATVWQMAIEGEERALGIPKNHPLSDYVISVFLDVRMIQNRAK